MIIGNDTFSLSFPMAMILGLCASRLPVTTIDKIIFFGGVSVPMSIGGVA